MSLTTDPTDARLGHGSSSGPEPQHEVYLVLTDEERAKGWIRPYRDAYRHVGPSGPRYALRALTPEQVVRYEGSDYVKYEAYPESESPKVGRYWTQAQLDKVRKGCGTVTTMGQELSETYARDPHFYGATYCVYCQSHPPVDEFVWIENDGRETERVGS